jgi:hypothetical protein
MTVSEFLTYRPRRIKRDDKPGDDLTTVLTFVLVVFLSALTVIALVG